MFSAAFLCSHFSPLRLVFLARFADELCRILVNRNGGGCALEACLFQVLNKERHFGALSQQYHFGVLVQKSVNSDAHSYERYSDAVPVSVQTFSSATCV